MKPPRSKLKTMKKQGTIIYIGDPMCSWCWGIAGELSKLTDQYSESLDFRLILGELRPGGGDPWTPAFKQFLRKHWEEVHHRSGQEFNYELLAWSSFHYDTEPPCRAVRTIRDMEPEKEFAFFKKTQYQFYVANKNPNTKEFYQKICEELKLDFEGFMRKFESEEYKIKTRQDFEESRELGIRGFPAVILELEHRLVPIALGFADYAIMASRIDAGLKEIPSLN